MGLRSAFFDFDSKCGHATERSGDVGVTDAGAFTDSGSDSVQTSNRVGDERLTVGFESNCKQATEGGGDRSVAGDESGGDFGYELIAGEGVESIPSHRVLASSRTGLRGGGGDDGFW